MAIFRFRYQPRNGSHVFLDIPVVAHVSSPTDDDADPATDVEIDRIQIGGIDVPTSMGMHADIHDYLLRQFATELVRILQRDGKTATAIERAFR
jgi:hypothetical protein